MPIRMQCRCGQEMVTQDQHVGKKVRCPGCKKLLLVPDPYRAEEEAELPVSASAEPTPLDIPDDVRVEDVPASARLSRRAGESEFSTARERPEHPAESSPLPKLEIPEEHDVPEMEPEQLDDDDLFDESDASEEDDEEIVETEAAEGGPPPLPGAPVPPPLPNDEAAKEESKDAWAGQMGVKVGEAKGEAKRPANMRPGEMGKTDRMMRAHFGLGLLLAMTFAWMLVMVLNVFFSLFGGFSVNSAASARGLTIALTLIRVGGWQMTSGLGLAGCLMFCWTTPKSGVKTLALVASAFLGAGMVFNFISLIAVLVSASVGAAVIGLICELFASVLGLVGVIIMLIFLRRFAKYLGDRGSVDEAYYLITAWPLVYYFIPILIICFALVLAKISLFLTFMFFIVAFIAWLSYWVTVLLRLINLIVTMRQIIAYRYQ